MLITPPRCPGCTVPSHLEWCGRADPLSCVLASARKQPKNIASQAPVLCKWFFSSRVTVPLLLALPLEELDSLWQWTSESEVSDFCVHDAMLRPCTMTRCWSFIKLNVVTYLQDLVGYSQLSSWESPNEYETHTKPWHHTRPPCDQEGARTLQSHVEHWQEMCTQIKSIHFVQTATMANQLNEKRGILSGCGIILWIGNLINHVWLNHITY